MRNSNYHIPYLGILFVLGLNKSITKLINASGTTRANFVTGSGVNESVAITTTYVAYRSQACIHFVERTGISVPALTH